MRSAVGLAVLTIAASGAAAQVADGPVVPIVPSRKAERAAREIGKLHALLERWVARDDWPRCVTEQVGSGFDAEAVMIERNPCQVVSSRLALFESRFGMRWTDAAGAESLAGLARASWTRIAVEGWVGMDEQAAERAAWTEPRWLATRALLLDLAGRGGDASEVLFGNVERFWWGCCPFDLSEDLFELTRARAELLDRAGETDAALPWYHAAFAWHELDSDGGAFGHPRITPALMMARYALLLERAGETELLPYVLATLRRTRPGSLAEEVARDLLRDARHWTAAPADDTPRPRVFLTSPGGDRLAGYHEDALAFTFGVQDDPSTWHRLACQLPLTADEAPQHGARAGPRDFCVVAPDDPRVAAFLAR